MYHLRFKGNKGFMCQYDKSLNFETVWSSIFDLDSFVIYRAEGNPRRCKFITDERLSAHTFLLSELWVLSVSSLIKSIFVILYYCYSSY